MLTAIEHLEQAKHNERLAEALSRTEYGDWRCTAIYYAALHFIQSYFSSLHPPRTFQSHFERDGAISADARLYRLRRDYRALKDWSRRSRYSGVNPTSADFATEITPALANVKDVLRPLLRRPKT